MWPMAMQLHSVGSTLAADEIELGQTGKAKAKAKAEMLEGSRSERNKKSQSNRIARK